MKFLQEAAMAHSARTTLDALCDQLSIADSMLDQGLKAIHQGSRLDAMESIYAASCLIGEIAATLEPARQCRNLDAIAGVPTPR